MLIKGERGSGKADMKGEGGGLANADSNFKNALTRAKISVTMTIILRCLYSKCNQNVHKNSLSVCNLEIYIYSAVNPFFSLVNCHECPLLSAIKIIT